MVQPDDFHDFVVSRRRSLLRTAWLLSGDWHAAEDLVQMALAQTYPHWRRVALDNPDAYVRRAIYNAHISRWRRMWRGERPTLDVPDVLDQRDRYDESDERARVLASIGALPPRQRAVIVLRFYEDMTEAETAAVMGCSVGTVKSQASKALAHLRRDQLLINESSIPEVIHERS